MSRRSRPIYFVLSAISDAELVFKTIESKSLNEAIDIFEKEFSIKPQHTAGPFYKKRSRIIEKNNDFDFSDEMKRAIYNDWLVNALFLKNMKNQAYLVFIRRVDNKKMQKPQGKVIVPISELRIL